MNHVPKKYLLMGLLLPLLFCTPAFFSLLPHQDPTLHNMATVKESFDSLHAPMSSKTRNHTEDTLSTKEKTGELIARHDSRFRALTQEASISQQQSKFTVISGISSTDSTTYLRQSNNSLVTILPDTTTYAFTHFNASLNIRTYQELQNYVLENDTSGSPEQLNGEYLAQGMLISELSPSSTPRIKYLNITNFIVRGNTFGSTNNEVVIGEIWSAKEYSSGMLIPSQIIDSTAYTTINETSSATQDFWFNFTTPVQITRSITFANDSGAYIFFVIHSNSSTSSNWYIQDADFTADNVDEGVTYYVTGLGNPPRTPNDNEWGTPTTTDIFLLYNATKEFYPTSLHTQVLTTSDNLVYDVSESGDIVDTVARTSENYHVIMNTSAPIGTYMNITISKFSFMKTNGIGSYETTPMNHYVKWLIQFNVTLDSTSSETKYFLSLQAFYNVSQVNKSSSILTQGNDYTLTTDVFHNQSILLYTSNGSYVVQAYTINQLWGSSPQIYKKTSETNSWIQTTRAFMGTLYPTITDGDLLKINITDISSLNLVQGEYNVSLYNPNHQILANQSQLGYIDKYLSTIETTYVGTIEFTTNLDPNITVGTWVFEITWFNGSSAGSVNKSLYVNPVTTVDLVTPSSSTTVMENDVLQVQIATLDFSHNTTWPGSSPGMLSWTFGVKTLSYQSFRSDNRYVYETSLNFSIYEHPVQTRTTYNITVTFSYGQYNDSTSFLVTVYYRGGTTLTGETTIYYLENLSLSLQAINETGSQILNDSSIEITSPFSFSSIFNSQTATFSIIVQWDPSFTVGTNEIVLRWSLPGYKQNTSSNVIEVRYVFTVINRPVEFLVDNSSFNNSLLLLQEAYTLQITVHDIRFDSIVDTGELVTTSNTNATAIDFELTAYRLSNGVFVTQYKLNSPKISSVIIEWEFHATGYETIKYLLVLHFEWRSLSSLVLYTGNATIGEETPAFVIFSDSINKTTLLVTSENTTNHLYVYSNLITSNGTSTIRWEIEDSGGFLAVYLLASEKDQGLWIQVLIPVQITGYKTLIVQVNYYVNPLIPTIAIISAPSTIEYLTETSIILQYNDSQGLLDTYSVNISSVNNPETFELISINTLPNNEKLLVFQINDYIQNNNLTLIVTLYKSGYTSQTLIVQITMTPTSVTIQANGDTNADVINENVRIEFNVTRQNELLPVQLLLVSYNSTLIPELSYNSLTYSSLLIIPLSNSDENSTLMFTIHTNSLIFNGSITIYITIDPLLQPEISYNVIGTLEPGETFSIIFKANISSTAGVALTALNQNTDFSSLSLNYSIIILLDDNQNVTYTDTLSFSLDGTAVAGPFTIPENAVDIQFTYIVNGLGYSSVEETPSLEFVIPTTITSSSLTVSTPLSSSDTRTPPTSNAIPLIYIEAVLGAIVAVLFLITLFIFIRKRKAAKAFSEAQVLSLIGEVSNALVLIIVDKRTGLSIYTHKFKDTTIDPQLLAGILQAYTAIDREMTGDISIDAQPGLYRIELGNHFIARIVGEPFDFYLISTGQLDIMLNQYETFATWFTQQYKTNTPITDTSILEDDNEIITYELNKSLYGWLNYELSVSETSTHKKLSRLEQRIIEVVESTNVITFMELLEELSGIATTQDIFKAVQSLFIKKVLVIANQ